MLTSTRTGFGADRGASMIAALAATMVVLGFGAVTLQLAQNHLREADRRLDRDEPTLHAEHAASQGVSQVLDGVVASATGSGTVDGADYDFTITNNGDETWTVVGRSGEGNAERTATAELRREQTNSAVAEVERYAAYAYDLLDIGWVRGGDVAGPVASGDRVKYWYTHSIGTRQDYVTTCENCPNPQINTSYVPLDVPSPSAPQACPVDGSYQLTGPVTLSGEYDCSSNQETLRISGQIDISGPVVIHVGDDTRLDVRNATINSGGQSGDFVIAKPTTTTWAYQATVDDTTMNARILAPENYVYVGDVTWRGTFEVGTWWLYDWATIDGAWDGPTIPTDPNAVAFGTSSYTLGTPDLSWTDAQAEAQAAGGKLVEINSADENAFVLATFGDGERSIPIGLSDVASEGDWVTVDGDPAPYLNWMSGEPDNAGGTQHYARIASVTGEWDDAAATENAFRRTASAPWTRTGSITVIEFEGAVRASSARTEWFLDGWQLD